MQRVQTRTRRTVVAIAAMLFAVAIAGPALAHGDDDHTHGFDDADFLDPMIWDGTSTIDCSAAAQGTIVWTLTGSDGVEYAELHIDEPEATVTAKTGGPYVWISPLYALDEIDADVDRIVGVLSDDARLDAVTCPDGGDEAGALGDLALPVGGGVVAGAILGFVLGSRRRSS